MYCFVIHGIHGAFDQTSEHRGTVVGASVIPSSATRCSPGIFIGALLCPTALLPLLRQWPSPPPAAHGRATL